jgi:tetratricopeptide (TPR) repeat protein
LLKSDPEYPKRDALYYHLGDSLVKMGRRAEAVPYFDRLLKEFEQSEYLAKAQLAMKEPVEEPAPPIKKDDKGKVDDKAGRSL